MAESIIWEGTSSHWKNFKVNTAALLSIPLAITLHVWLSDKGVGLWVYLLPAVMAVWALWCLLVLKTTKYRLTSERLVTERGVLTKVTDILELYRVRDMQVVQPLLLRIVGLQNVSLTATDATTASVLIDFLPAKLNIGEQFRTWVEKCREAKRVRAFDVVNEAPGDSAAPDGNPIA